MNLYRNRPNQRVYYVVRKANTRQPVTGDAANHTVSWIQDGVRAAAANAPTEVDATNAPGLYEATPTMAESDYASVQLAATTSTGSTFVEVPAMGPTLDGGVPMLGPFAATGTPTTTTVTCEVSADAADDDYFPHGANDGAARFLIVQSGDRRGEMVRIASSTIVGTTLTLTFGAMKEAMDAGDTFRVGGLS